MFQGSRDGSDILFIIYEAEKIFHSCLIGVFLIHVFLQGFVGYPETVFLFFLSFCVVGVDFECGIVFDS